MIAKFLPYNGGNGGRYQTIGDQVCVDHSLFCKCSKLGISINTYDIGYVQGCSDIWTLVNIVLHWGKKLLVFHSKTYHIEIPEKRKSAFVCSWAQVLFKLRKMPMAVVLKQTKIKVGDSTLHKIGEKQLYSAGHKIYSNSRSLILQSKDEVKQTMLPKEYYMLGGMLIHPNITMGTDSKYVCLSKGLNQQDFWLGFRVKQKTGWMFCATSKDGNIIKEKKVCKFSTCDEIDFFQVGTQYWCEAKAQYNYTKLDLLFDFDVSTHCIKVGDKTLDSSKVLTSIEKGESCFMDGLFLVSLIGQNPCSMRVCGDNLSFVTHPLQLTPIEIITGHVFTITNFLAIDRMNLAQTIMDNVKTGKMYSSEKPPSFVEMIDSDGDFIYPILSLFRNTMSIQQKSKIQKVKAYFVHSPLVRNQFLTACGMLELDGVSTHSELVFHGIRKDSQLVADRINKLGFQCDLNSGGNLYGRGTYGAQEARYCLDGGYSEFPIGDNNLKNCIFVALILPGRSVLGTPGKIMGREEDSCYGITTNGKILCCQDRFMMPIVLINY